MSKANGELLFNGCRPIIEKMSGTEKADEILEMAHKRYYELLEENKNEPEAMDPHTKERIYPGISVFESLLKAGYSREDAAQVIYDFYDTAAKKGAKKITDNFKSAGPV